MVSCIVLSAGLSQRFGSPKALAEIQNEKVIECIQRMLLTTSVEEIIIVLGHESDQIKPFLLKHKRIRFVYNKDYNLGQTSSFKTGLAGVDPKASGIMLLPVDFPFINPQTVDQMINQFNTKKPLILIPMYQNKKGHPPIFSARLRNEFLEMDTSVGLNWMAKKYSTEAEYWEVNDAGVLKSFNTPEELRKIIDVPLSL